MLKEIIIAIQSYGKAHQFIKQHKLWKWIIIPGLIYAFFFMVGLYYFTKTQNFFFEWLSIKTGLKGWIGKLDISFLSFLLTLHSFILYVVSMQFYFSLFKYVVLIGGSPLFAFLSEKTEAIMEESTISFSILQLAKDIIRGSAIAARNALWQTVYSLAIILMCIIPIVGLVTPLIALLIECYYYGFSLLDYSMERRKQTMSQSIFFITHHKGISIGNGMMFYLMHLIPILGWVLAPAYSIIAATISIITINQQTTSVSIEPNQLPA